MVSSGLKQPKKKKKKKDYLLLGEWNVWLVVMIESQVFSRLADLP